MAKLEAIDRYLRNQKARQERGPGRPGGAIRPFITISREAGAGGHTLADALLENFEHQEDTDLFKGWQVFDRRLCELVADDPAYRHSLQSLLAEEYRTRADEFFHQILRSSVDQRAVMERVFRVVRAVASVGKAIIVGRAGEEVTRDIGPGITVRLVAPEDVRIRGVMDHYGLSREAALEEAKRLDEARARLLKTHFRVDIEDPLRYDAVFNTGLLPIEAVADAVATMLLQESRAPRSARPL